MVLLVGMRGSGKSAVGRALAATLGARFLDLDDEVLRRAGHASVAAMWDAEGQAAFRDAETRTLRDLLTRSTAPTVLALGGGTPTAPGASEVINAARARGEAVAIYLVCALGTLEARLRESLARDANRPSVTGADPLRELAALLAARDQVYRSVCDEVVRADDAGIEEVASRVAGVVRRRGDSDRR